MTQPTHHEYRAPGNHNGPAILSLVCAITWPLTIIAMMLANSASNAPGSSGPALPEQMYTLLECGFSLLPVAGIISGGVGLYRAAKQSLLLSTRWLAAIGLLLSCLWFAGTFLLSELGSALVYWVQHL